MTTVAKTTAPKTAAPKHPKQTVGVVFGGRSAEHKVSIVSARTVATALRAAGYGVLPLGIAQDGCWVDPVAGARALDGETDVLAPVGGTIRRTLRHLVDADLDVVFPIVHGTWGEDGTLQGLCEMLDLPYVGTGVASSAVCMDKVMAKQVFAAVGLDVVDGETVTRRAWTDDRDEVLDRCRRLGAPLFVKPSVGGSSVGVRRVADLDDPNEGLAASIDHALYFDDRLVVERGVDGRELECAVLGYGRLEASGVGEIVPGQSFYDYADKYLEDGAELIHAADLSDEVEAEIRRRAVAAMEAVGGWGMARVDFLLEGDVPYLNEINTLPGFTSISMYPKLWERAGLAPAALVERLVDAAIERHADRQRLDQGIKAWIAALEDGLSGQDLYRVDLAEIIAKYIGETEKR